MLSRSKIKVFPATTLAVQGKFGKPLISLLTITLTCVSR